MTTHSWRNGCSASRHGPRFTICPSLAVCMGAGRLVDLGAGISDHYGQEIDRQIIGITGEIVGLKTK